MSIVVSSGRLERAIHRQSRVRSETSMTSLPAGWPAKGSSLIACMDLLAVKRAISEDH